MNDSERSEDSERLQRAIVRVAGYETGDIPEEWGMAAVGAYLPDADARYLFAKALSDLEEGLRRMHEAAGHEYAEAAASTDAKFVAFAIGRAYEANE